MTKQEAIAAMKAGKKITHTYFTDDEWMTSSPNGRQIILEDGVKCFEGEFWHFRQGKEWEDGYSEWKEPVKREFHPTNPNPPSWMK